MIGAAGIESSRRLRTDHVACSRILVLAALLGTAPAFAQTWRIVPSISVAETLTDNVSLAPDNRKQSDLITQVSPGVNVQKTSGRLKLNLNYRATGLFYAKNSDQNDIQNYLDAAGTLEAVENWLFVDASANVSQQAFSAFGAQSNLATENINANRAETLTYRVSPYVRGRFGNTADYELRYSLSGSKVRGNELGETTVEEWGGRITGRESPMGFGWALGASYNVAHADEARDVSSRRVNGSLSYRFDPQVRVSALAGWESNNYSTTNDSSAATYGAQLEWTPTERTRINALAERRPFTNTHQIGITHRTRLTAWQFSDSKSVTTLPAQLTVAQLGTAFDLLFNALATRFPDPIQRAAEVDRQLRLNGIPRDLALATAFLSSQAFVQRARQLSVAILGVRNTVTLAASLVESRAIETGSPLAGDFSTTSEVEQRSLTANWAHQMSAVTTMNLLATHTRSKGASGTGPETTEKSARLLLTHQLSPKTSGTIGLRYIRFDSTTADDFREKAITGTLLVRFY